MGKKILQYWIYLAVCTFTLQVATVLFQPTEAFAAQPNIILINVDNMGWGDLCSNVVNSAVKPAWCTANPSGTSKLDNLADRGITLSNFYATSPLCTPSRAALMTGRDPIHIGNGVAHSVSSINYLPLSETTIANVLKSMGYNTAIIGKWNLSWGVFNGSTYDDSKDSWKRGFDYNYALPLGVHYGHTGFCIAEKNKLYPLNDSANPDAPENYTPTEWHYIKTLAFEAPYTLPNQYDADDNAMHACNPNIQINSTPMYSLNNVTCSFENCTAYINTQNDIKLFVWDDFWSFSKTEYAPQPPSNGYSLTRVLTEKAKQYILNQADSNGKMERDASKPFFLYLAYPAPHGPVYIHLGKDSSENITNAIFESGKSTCKSFCDQNCNSIYEDPCIEKCTNKDNKQVDEVCKNNCLLSSKVNFFQTCVYNYELDNLYAGAIAGIDYNVGLVVDALSLKGISDDTIIIFTSDNGPFMSHNDEYHPTRSGRTGGMRGGQKFTYEGGTRVPFIAYWSGKWQGTADDRQYVKLDQFSDMTDIFPTLIKAAGGNVDNNTAGAATTITYDDYVLSNIDGKNMSDILERNPTVVQLDKDVHLSMLDNFGICTNWFYSFIWSPSGYCTNYEDSHSFAIRSNNPPTVEVLTRKGTTNIFALNNFKLYLNSNALNDIGGPEELYDLAQNSGELEDGGNNLCMAYSVNFPYPLINYCTAYCTDSATFTCSSPAGAKWSESYRVVVEKLWEKAHLYYKYK